MSNCKGIYLGPYIKLKSVKGVDCRNITLEDEFWIADINNCDVLLPNKHLPGITRGFNLENSNEGTFSMIENLDTPLVETSAFRDYYGIYFEDLEKAYNQKVVVDWGVIIWEEK